MYTQTISKTQAIYNRSGKRWQVIAPTGEIINEFPAGEQGKRAASMEAIRYADPVGYRQAVDFRSNIFLSYPMTWPRIWKAARIVADGQVFEAHPLSPNAGQEAYHVHSQSEAIFYTVTSNDKFYSCTCPDFDEFHAPTVSGQKLCKHIFAVKIMKGINRPAPAFFDSPREIWRHLEETTTAYTVIGAYNRRPYLYAQPQQRPAVAGEIVWDGEGNAYRLTHNGQRFGSWKITINAEPEPATAAAEVSEIAQAIRRRYSPTLDPHEQAAIDTGMKRGNNPRRRELNRMQREQAERNAAKAYREKTAAQKFEEAAAAVNGELFG